MNKTTNYTIESIQNATATLNLEKGSKVTIDQSILISPNLSSAFNEVINSNNKVSVIQTLTDLDGTVDKRFFFENENCFVQVIYDEDDLNHLRRSLKLWVLAESPATTSDSLQEESIRHLLANEITVNGKSFERTNREIQYEFLSVEHSTSMTSLEQQFNTYERYINDDFDVEELRCFVDGSDSTGQISYWLGIDIAQENLTIEKI